MEKNHDGHACMCPVLLAADGGLPTTGLLQQIYRSEAIQFFQTFLG